MKHGVYRLYCKYVATTTAFRNINLLSVVIYGPLD